MLTSLFQTKQINRLFLEELVAAEFEGALHEVAGEGGTEACCESAYAFVLDDLAEAADHATVVGRGVELDPCLDST